MASHLEMETEENIRRGMTPAEAHRRAMMAAGGATQAAELVREQRGIPWIENLAADVRFALRQYRRTPLSTVSIILVLSIGMGATVVLFTVFNSVATMPAPGIERDASLVRIRGALRMGQVVDVQPRLLSWPEVQEYSDRSDIFTGVAAYADETALLQPGDDGAPPVTVRATYTTPNYFDLLGVSPTLGRPPASDGLELTSSPSAVISHALWRQAFAGDPGVIGQTVRVNGTPLEIVGVAPPRFAGTDGRGGPAIWMPLAAYPLVQKRTAAAFLSYDTLFLGAAARLRPGVTSVSATSVLRGLAERAPRARRNDAMPEPTVGSIDVVPMLASNARVSGRKDLLDSATVSAVFVLVILLVTCSNVSALLVGLAGARRREIGVRLSLGAPRRRLVRQLLTESLVLALISATLGLGVTAVGIGLVTSTMEGLQLAIDARVVVATCLVALATGVAFGVSPALHATRVSIGDVLKRSSGATTPTRSRLQPGIVVAQIALTQPLLVGLGVVISTMASDFSTGGVSPVADRIAEIELDTWAGRASLEERAALIAEAVERVASLPGVVMAIPMEAGTTSAPLTVHPDDRIAGVTHAGNLDASLTAAPPGYFDILGLRILRGRDFMASERLHEPGDALRAPSMEAIILGRALARRLWGEADPVGRRLVLATGAAASSAPMEVVGVVEEGKGLESERSGHVRVYVPYAPMNTGVVARTHGPAAPHVNEMRRAISALAPQMPVSRAETLEQREARERRAARRAGGAAAAGGAVALLLSAIGLYAVVASSVGSRRREVGIRTALGARGSQVVRMFFLRGLALGAIGLLVGVPLAMLATRLVSGTLGWSLSSPQLLQMGIAIGVLVVAAVAVWIPARRASGIDAVTALRSE